MPEEAFRVHGLSDEFLADKPLFAELADDFLEFIEGARLIIHNAPFDMGFINHELEMLGKPPIPMTNVVDSLQIARRKHPGAANSLDALCRRYGVDNSARDKHGALLDSEILAEVYLHLIGGHQARLDLDGGNGDMSGRGAKPSLSLHAGRNGAAETIARRTHPLPSRLSDDEIRAHEEFVTGLGEKPLWNLYLKQPKS